MPSWLYHAIVVAHILFAIIGFGGVTLNGLYAAQARKRQGSEGIAIMEANAAVTRIAEVAIFLVLVSGLILVATSNRGIAFAQTWVWLSIVLFVAALALSYGVMQPAGRRMLGLAEEPGAPPPARQAEIIRLGRELALVGGVLHALLLAMLILMVIKPGLTAG